MSAFLCDSLHLSILGAYAVKKQPVSLYRDGMWQTFSEPELIAELLYHQNQRSINERYSETDNEPFTFDHRAMMAVRQYTPVEIIKACHCYAYQACETDDYADTLTAALIADIIDTAVRALPGYQDAHWGIRKPE